MGKYKLWVLVCDTDDLLEIDFAQIINEDEITRFEEVK